MLELNKRLIKILKINIFIVIEKEVPTGKN
jgi:hypothetical protein